MLGPAELHTLSMCINRPHANTYTHKLMILQGLTINQVTSVVLNSYLLCQIDWLILHCHCTHQVEGFQQFGWSYSVDFEASEYRDHC